MKTLPLSFIELSEKNLIQNIKQFKNLAKKDTKLCVAVKGNAYGHGQNQIAKILEPHVDYFQVDGIEELELLRKISKKKTLVLGYVQNANLQKLIKLRCTVAVFTFQQLKKINIISKKLKTKQDIHLSVDAYLGREGFLLKELPKFFEEIKKCKCIKLTGIYEH